MELAFSDATKNATNSISQRATRERGACVVYPEAFTSQQFQKERGQMISYII
jgi:hypothetical protein